MTTPASATTTYGYDALNRLSSISYSDGTPSVGFSYDGDGNRTEMTDGAGSVSYSYDDLNRLTGVSRGSDSFSYSYDPDGNLTERTYPGGASTTYTYDDDSRLATVTNGGNTTSYGYDAAGNETQMTRPASNGWNETRTYDPAGRLTEIKNANGSSTLSQFDYTYDPVGNPLSVTRLSSSENYQYDNRDRLTKVCYDADCAGASDYISWTYDGVGNRLAETRPTGTTTYSYDADDELTQAQGPSGTTTYAYDTSGNETQAGSRSFTYNLANHIKTTTDAGVTTTYSYDGDGNRLSASDGTTTTNYLWDIANPLPQLAVERDGSGNALRTYIQGLGAIAMVSGGQTYYFHTDALGSVTKVTSSTGQTEWTYTYEPYGNPRATTKDDPFAPNNLLRFAGEYVDATGLYDLRARDYDPTTGQFLQTDPKPAGNANPYEASYVYGNDEPTAETDPSGQCGAACAGGADAACGATVELPGIDIATCGAAAVATVAAVVCFLFCSHHPSGATVHQQSRSQPVPAPRNLPGFPGARRVRPKTPVQGGGGLRARWKDSSGRIYEWDSQHGTVEVYDRRGRNLGEFDPNNGDRTKPANPKRRVEP